MSGEWFQEKVTGTKVVNGETIKMKRYELVVDKSDGSCFFEGSVSPIIR